MIMDNKSRDFFSNFGMKTATVAVGAAAEVKEQIHSLHNRQDGAVLTLSYQQIQLYFIFLLLVISLAIDAGMTAIWVIS